MASTGDFQIGSSPTMTGNMTATCYRNGSSVVVDWTAAMRFTYSGSYLGTGNVITINVSGSAGGSGSGTMHGTNDVWNGGTDWHYCSGSFSYNNASAHNFTVTFSSTTNTSTSGKFSGKSVSLSIGAYDADKTFAIILCNEAPYFEFMSKSLMVFPTWSATDGQDDIVWINLGAGSWSRFGTTFSYAAGHTHSGASLDDSWNTHVYDSSLATCYGAVTYYPKIYVKYNANGGSSTPSTQTKYIGSQLTLASAISRTHYSFLGWSTSSTATSASYAAGKVIDYEAWNSTGNTVTSNNGWNDTIPAHSGNTVTLYAVWKGNTYTISYNANGGSSTPSSSSVVYPNSVTLASAIARNNSSSTSTGTITISYNVNGGSSTAPTASTGTYTNTTTTKYTFEKWHLNSTTGTAYSAGASYAPSANVTMYAGWTSSASTARTSNPSITLTSTKPTKANTTVSSYTVSYNANGGSSTPSNQTATKTRSYTFSKWNTNSGGTGTDYSGGVAYTFSANATLYAKYTSSDSGGSVTLASAISRANGSTTGYSITYNANGGSGAPSTQTSGNRTITYTFNKWAAGSATGTTYSAGGSFTPSANTTMYATWNSSTSANSAWTCSNTIPTKTGYTFLGWATSSTATTVTYTAGTAYTITGDLTLYAVWKANVPSNLNLQGTKNTTTSISLSLNATSAIDITNYIVYYKTASETTYDSISFGASNTGTLTGLDVDTNYIIYFTAENASGISSNSNSITYSTLLEYPSINTPIVNNLLPFSCTITASGSVTPSRTLSYRFSKDGGTTWTEYQSSNSYNWTGLNEETTYNMKVQVKATHIGNNSSDTTATSDILTIITPADQAKTRIKKEGIYIQGKTYFKDNDEWKKVKKIYKKVNGQWQIGQNS